MPIFDSKSLHDAVTTELKASGVPDDHKNAFSLVATTSGVKAVLSTKIGDHWEVASVIGVDTKKHVEGGVEVKATW